MLFVIINNTPFYYMDGCVLPCELSADKVTIAEVKKRKLKKATSTYSLSEVRALLGIFMTDTWDEKTKKLVRVSNKTVKSKFEPQKEQEKNEDANKTVEETTDKQENVEETGASTNEEPQNSEENETSTDEEPANNEENTADAQEDANKTVEETTDKQENVEETKEAPKKAVKGNKK